MAGNSQRKGAMRKTGTQEGADRRVRAVSAVAALERQGPDPEGRRAHQAPAAQAGRAQGEGRRGRGQARRPRPGSGARGGTSVAQPQGRLGARRRPQRRRRGAARERPRHRAVRRSCSSTATTASARRSSSRPRPGLPLLEAPRAELDRLTDGALHQGLALQVPPYEYADPTTCSRSRPRPASRR